MALPKTVSDKNQNPREPLTTRELEILRLLAQGLTNQKIGLSLALSLDTVKWYNKRIYRKLGAKNRAAAVKQASTLGLLSPGNNTAVSPPPPTPAHHLPTPVAPFIGRESETQTLSALLQQDNVRLITIVAIGGMGKTRLAIEVAKSQLDHFDNAVYFIPLVQLRTAGSIISAIAVQLRAQLTAGIDPAEQLLNHLREKSLLLVLDNFEHLLGGATLVAHLLENAPRIKIIATSRERLNIRGETLFEIGGLTEPATEKCDTHQSNSASKLFIDRIPTQTTPTQLSKPELAHIGRICQLVGGMPLGIELAASLADVLSLEEIAAEIEHSFDILATDMRDVPARQRSIRAAFDYSWSQLKPNEQAVYMRLAVFPASFTRNAAEAISGANLLVLKKLVHKSLIQRESNTNRYLIHELLRQYAEEKLNTAGLASDQHYAHTVHYMELLIQNGQALKGANQVLGLTTIEAEFENIQVAWSHAVDQKDLPRINRAIEPLYWFCYMRDRVATGEQLLKQARDRIGVSFAAQDQPIHRYLSLRFDVTDKIYQAQAKQAVSRVRANNDRQELVFFLWMHGYNFFFIKNFAQAIAIFAEAIELAEEIGETFYRAECLHWLGVCYRFLGRLEKTRTCAKKIRVLCRKTGNEFALARSLGSHAIYETMAGSDRYVKEDLEEAIALRSKLGYEAGVAISLVGLGMNEFFQGHLKAAKERLNDGLMRATNSNSLFPKAMALNFLAWIAAVEEKYDRAWQLCEEAGNNSSNPNLAITDLLGRAMAACGLRNFTQAQEYLTQWFSFDHPMRTPKGSLIGLSVQVIIYANQGHFEQAAELLSLIHTHPDSPMRWIKQWPLLQRCQSEIKRQLGDTAYQAAWERGKKLDPQQIKISPPSQ